MSGKFDLDTYLIFHLVHTCNSSVPCRSSWQFDCKTLMPIRAAANASLLHNYSLKLAFFRRQIAFSSMTCREVGGLTMVARPFKHPPKRSLFTFCLVVIYQLSFSAQHLPHHLHILIATGLYIVVKLQQSSTCSKTPPTKPS